jgi:hypothetical protein
MVNAILEQRDEVLIKADFMLRQTAKIRGTTEVDVEMKGIKSIELEFEGFKSDRVIGRLCELMQSEAMVRVWIPRNALMYESCRCANRRPMVLIRRGFRILTSK